MLLAVLLTHNITEAAFLISPTARVKKPSLLEAKPLAVVNNRVRTHISACLMPKALFLTPKLYCSPRSHTEPTQSIFPETNPQPFKSFLFCSGQKQWLDSLHCAQEAMRHKERKLGSFHWFCCQLTLWPGASHLTCMDLCFAIRTKWGGAPNS